MSVYSQFQSSRPQPTASGTSVYSQFLNRNAQEEKKPGFISGFVSGFKEKMLAGGKKQDLGEKGLGSFKDIGATGYKATFDTAKDAQKKITSGLNRATKAARGEGQWTDVIVAPAELGLGIVGSVFAPFVGVFEAAEEIPGLGYGFTTFNSFFAGMGSGSANVALKGLNKTPLSEASKQNLAPVVTETASLIGMLIGGKLTHSAYERTVKKVEANTKKITDGISRDVTTQLTVKSQSPEARQVELNRFYDEGNMPVIDWGKPAKSDLPTIQIEDTTTARPPFTGTRYVTDKPTTPLQERFTKETSQPTGTEFQSRTGVRTAEESGLGRDAVPFQDRRSMQEAYKTADDYVLADPVKAERALADPTTAPRDLYVGDIYKALEAKALREGDVALSLRLSQTTVGTEAARGLKAFDRPTDGSINLIQEIREVRAAREAWQESMNKGLVIEKEAAKLTSQAEPIRSPKIKDWQEFIKSLEC